MSVFAGILTGLGEAHHEHNQELMKQEVDRRKQLSEFWLSQANAPDVRPEAKDIATQKYLNILQHPLDKKLPKGLEGLDDFLHVTPKIGQTVAPPTQQAAAPAPPPGVGEGIHGQAAPPVAPPFITQDTLNAPGEMMGPRFSFDEQLAMKKRAGAVDVDLAGQKAGAEESAKLNAQYGDPKLIDAMVRTERAKKVPIVLPENYSGLAVPTADGKYEIIMAPEGGKKPRVAPSAEHVQNAGVVAMLEKKGLLGKVKLDPSFPFMQQIPAAMMPEAIQAAKELERDPDMAAARADQALSRGLQRQEMQLRMREYETLRGPEAMEAYRQEINANPDAIEDLDVKLKAAVRQYMLARGDRFPAKIPAQEKGYEFNAYGTLERIHNVRDLVTKYPDLIGPVSNFVQKGQKLSGVALSTPERAQASQELSTALVFLSTIEAKAILGSRPAFAWAEAFKEANANQKQQLPIFLGALKQQEEHANIVLRGIDKARYGTQKAGAPQPPPGAAASVRMTGPGGTFDVPADQVEVFKKNGYK